MTALRRQPKENERPREGMKEWRECRIAWIGGEEGEQHGWYYASVGRTYLGLLEQCNPGLMDIRRSITLPDGANIHVGRVSGNRFIKIDIREVKVEGDVLYMESGFIAIGNPNEHTGSVADTPGTYLQIPSTVSMEALKSPRVLALTAPDGGIQGVPKSYSLPANPLTGELDASFLGRLTSKNFASAYNGPSMYSGRMRLFVQSKLGKKLSSQTIVAADETLFWNGRPLGWSAGFTTGLMYDATLKTYFLIDWFANGLVYATRLVLGTTPKLLRTIWEAETDPVTKRVIEAYILSAATIDPSYSAVPIAVLAAPEGFSLYYGLKFDADGHRAGLVTHTFSETEQKHHAWRYSFAFGVVRNEETGAYEWTVSMTKEEDVRWYSNQIVIWFPGSDQQAHAQPNMGTGAMATCNVPIACYFDADDDLVVARYHLSEFGASTTVISSGNTASYTCHDARLCGSGTFSSAQSAYNGVVTASEVSIGQASLGSVVSTSRTLTTVSLTRSSEVEAGPYDIFEWMLGNGFTDCDGVAFPIEFWDNFTVYGKLRGGHSGGTTKAYSEYSQLDFKMVMIPFDDAQAVFLGRFTVDQTAWQEVSSRNLSLEAYAMQGLRRVPATTPPEFIPISGWISSPLGSWFDGVDYFLCVNEVDAPLNKQNVSIFAEVILATPSANYSIRSSVGSGDTYGQALANMGIDSKLEELFQPSSVDRLGLGERPEVASSLNAEVIARLTSAFPKQRFNGYPESGGARAVSIGWQ